MAGRSPHEDADSRSVPPGTGARLCTSMLFQLPRGPGGQSTSSRPRAFPRISDHGRGDARVSGSPGEPAARRAACSSHSHVQNRAVRTPGHQGLREESVRGHPSSRRTRTRPISADADGHTDFPKWLWIQMGHCDLTHYQLVPQSSLTETMPGTPERPEHGGSHR